MNQGIEIVRWAARPKIESTPTNGENSGRGLPRSFLIDRQQDKRRSRSTPQRCVMVNPSIGIPRSRIEDFCERWHIVELALFGSALRDDFRPESDLDVLATFAPEANWSLLDHLRMEQELAKLLSREIDLFTRDAVEHSHNWMRRQEILGTAEVIYGTR